MNVVPENGADAWAQGWDVTACPFTDLADKERWKEEYFAAADAAYKDYCRENP